MTVDTVRASGNGPPLGLLETHVESFLTHLRTLGYAQRTLRKKRSIAVSFARWTRRHQVTLETLSEVHVAAFVERCGQRSKTRVRFELAAVRPLLGYLRINAGLPTPPLRIDSSAAGELERRYGDYLRTERGLTERSICVYLPFIHDLLGELVAKTGSASPVALDALIVRDFLLDRVGERLTESSRLLATALRSFLRFLYLRGETAIDLSPCVPTVRKWRQAAVPAFLSPKEVERVLSATNRSTARGRRDHAILLLLARLGMRAGEVVGLELEDIR